MPASSIRIGLIGAGKNTRERHIPGFQAIDGVEVVSVCNRSLESSQRVADQFGIPKVIENWQDLVADDDINAVCIGTWAVPALFHDVSQSGQRKTRYDRGAHGHERRRGP